jgi:hypothetical protein
MNSIQTANLVDQMASTRQQDVGRRLLFLAPAVNALAEIRKIE